MERDVEVSLMDELVRLKQERKHFTDEANGSVPVEHYFAQDRFEAERAAIFKRLPRAVLHSQELEEPGAFRVVELEQLSILVTRRKDGSPGAFLNVCRHRGARLVAQQCGHASRFSCPYHAWTYSSAGELVSGPHLASGFPDLDKAQSGLVPVPVYEAHGLIWVVAQPRSSFDFESYLAPIAHELASLDLSAHRIVADDTIDVAANWKILVEGGIESYHFKIAHRDTIAPFFEDNLSSYQTFEPHMRSVLPRATMAKLDGSDRENWRIRDHANLLYTVFPALQFLVQQDHIVMIVSQPKAANHTVLRIATLAPADEIDGQEEHWARNHAITRKTLDEDFALGEGIQSGLAMGANATLSFARFEGALTEFNQLVDRYVSVQH